jgi:hypothetical protein
MTSLNLPAKGSCQCGDVTYQVVEQPLATVCCHCVDCQKLSASSFSISMVLNRSGLEILTGDLKRWDRAAASGNVTRCWFCPTCGNRIYHENPESPELIRFKPGTLDDTSVLSPQGHTWTCREQPWHQTFNELPRIEGQPDFAAAIKAIREGGSPF